MPEKTDFGKLVDQLQQENTPYTQHATEGGITIVVQEPRPAPKTVYRFTRDGRMVGQPEVYAKGNVSKEGEPTNPIDIEAQAHARLVAADMAPGAAPADPAAPPPLNDIIIHEEDADADDDAPAEGDAKAPKGDKKTATKRAAKK